MMNAPLRHPLPAPQQRDKCILVLVQAYNFDLKGYIHGL